MTTLDDVGGRGAVEALVELLFGDELVVGSVVADPVLGPFFTGTSVERHKQSLATELSRALGGQILNTPRLTARHAGRGIGPAHFDRLLMLIEQGLDQLDVDGPVAGVVLDKLAVLEPVICDTPDDDPRIKVLKSYFPRDWRPGVFLGILHDLDAAADPARAGVSNL